MLGQELKGRYKIIATLNSGGFGQTYIAEDTQRPGRPQCVVKQLMPVSKDSGVMEISRRLFNSEAQILERVGRHDQIPQLLAYFEENKEFYLVQEFIEGHPLSEELQPGKQMPEGKVIALLQDILKILEFVHAHGAIHRDIKPNNIIRRQRDGKLVLIDFGAVKEIHTQFSSSTVAIGTKGYAAPEQALGHPQFSSDIYAVGITAIQALTGILPLQLPEDSNTGNLIWRNRLQVSDELAVVLDKMICHNWSGRYQSAIEVLEDLKSITNSTDPIVVTSPSIEPTPTLIYPQRATKFNLLPELKAKLEALLGEAIGPIAPLILKQTLNQASTAEDLIERLMLHLPVNRQVNFRTSAQAAIAAFNSGTNLTLPAIAPPVKTTPPSAPPSQLDPKFIQRCQQELSDFIGPMAAYICKRTLTQNPGISVTQFVEALAQQIPNEKQALEFRRRLLS
jgi:serine/threonine protein kinase